MKAMWNQRSTSRDWSAAYRGLTIRIKVDPESGNPTEISWYIGGVLSEASPVDCSLSVAQKISVRSWIPKFRKTRTGLKPSIGISAGYSSGAEGKLTTPDCQPVGGFQQASVFGFHLSDKYQIRIG
jgi:hypothetical protein